MSKSDTFENQLLQHIFQNAAITLIGDAAGVLPSADPGNLYVSLHTADPGETGDQSTSETNYANYLRKAVVRSAVGWTVTNDTVANAAQVQFATCGASTATLRYFGIGCSSGTGAGKLLYSGQLTSPLDVSNGIQPQFAAGDLTVTEA